MSSPHRRLSRKALVSAPAAAGIAIAIVVSVAVAATGSDALHVATQAKVTNTAGVTKLENIAVTKRGRAVYELSGDSRHHPKCTRSNGCFQFWPPVKVHSSQHLKKASGIKGKLGTWRRDGFLQLTLSGHPLYMYAGDGKADIATGQGIRTFGGTWTVVRAGGTVNTAPPTTTSSTTMSSTSSSPTSGSSSTTTTSTTTTCPYPPCY
jgi:predicted lipoprotein with Yx(FWY)xxD motif